MQNLIHDLHHKNIIELMQRAISLLVLNEFICVVENNSIIFSACDLQKFMDYLYVYT